MVRALALATLVLAGLAAPAGALVVGVQAGLYSPTKNAKQLLNSEYQVGLRFLLPPLTPLGVIPIDGLNLDLGVDLGLGAAKQLSVNNLDTQVVNVSTVYRYTFPFSESILLYFGLGARLTTVWGELSKDLASGSLLGHLRGSFDATAGLDYLLGPATLLDLRVGYGIFGFTSWEATAGLMVGF
jgi:hypothetical protein